MVLGRDEESTVQAEPGGDAGDIVLQRDPLACGNDPGEVSSAAVVLKPDGAATRYHRLTLYGDSIRGNS